MTKNMRPKPPHPRPARVIAKSRGWKAYGERMKAAGRASGMPRPGRLKKRGK